MEKARFTLVLMVCFLHMLSDLVVARNWKLSKRDDLELERQLKRLNKPAIKTIHTDHGDLYDCVDFYQQPAFDHPLLKNHSYQFEMETASLHNETQDQSLSLFFDLKDEECPIGTVIIKRVTKDDLIRERLASKRKTRRVTTENSETHDAVVHTLLTLDTYTGASGSLGIYNPPVNGKQYSSARIVLTRGIDRIEAGTRVDPSLYNDGKTHFYLRTEASESASYCFGTSCPGFVVTSRRISIDATFVKTISDRGGDNYFFPIDIQRNKATGNWHLQVGAHNIALGYWPKAIFAKSGLGDEASYIEWGGEVYCPPDYPNTIMGYGNYPIKDTQDTAFIKKLAYRENYSENKDALKTETYEDSEKYKVVHFQDINDDYFGHILLYGGPILDKK